MRLENEGIDLAMCPVSSQPTTNHTIGKNYIFSTKLKHTLKYKTVISTGKIVEITIIYNLLL